LATSLNGQSTLNHDVLQLGYEYIKEKFECSTETIRRHLVLLENLGLIKREFRHEKGQDKIVANVLFIHVFKQTPYFISDVGVDNPDFVQSQPIEHLVENMSELN